MDARVPTLLELYERAIAACDARDVTELEDAVGELGTTLAFDLEEAARELAWLYGLSLRAAENGRFELARLVFAELHAVVQHDAKDHGEFPL